jgi:hypothetical protein
VGYIQIFIDMVCLVTSCLYIYIYIYYAQDDETYHNYSLFIYFFIYFLNIFFEFISCPSLAVPYTPRQMKLKK